MVQEHDAVAESDTFCYFVSSTPTITAKTVQVISLSNCASQLHLAHACSFPTPTASSLHSTTPCATPSCPQPNPLTTLYISQHPTTSLQPDCQLQRALPSLNQNPSIHCHCSAASRTGAGFHVVPCGESIIATPLAVSRNRTASAAA